MVAFGAMDDADIKAVKQLFIGLLIGAALVFAAMYDRSDEPPTVSDEEIADVNTERRILENEATAEAYFEEMEERDREPLSEE